MKVATVTIHSLSPYSPSRWYKVPKLPQESAADYETRTWRERAHVNEDGNIFIPPMAFKNCLTGAAEYLKMRIPGKGAATYAKHVKAGIMVTDPLVLPEKKDSVAGNWLFVPSDGRRGGGSRVEKCFPIVHSWKGEVAFHILDETVTRDVFEQHIVAAGSFVGIGSFRPANNGYFGRFALDKLQWT